MKSIGVIGLGSIGMRHAINLRTMGHKVYRFDTNPLTHLFNTEQWNGEDFTGLDAVVVASPTDDHAFRILTDLVKIPMFVEKPIGGAVTDVVEIKSALKFSKHPLMVGYNLRYHPCVLQARDWLNDNAIGRRLWANFTVGQFSQKAPYLRDGVILNWSHEIDLALHLLGPATVMVSSVRLNGGHDDIADILLRHEDDTRSTVHLDYVTRPEVRQTIIAGEDGQIICDLANRQAWLRGTDGDLRDQFVATDGWDDDYIEEITDFLNLLDGNGLGFHCTGEQALQVLDICLEVRKQAGL